MADKICYNKLSLIVLPGSILHKNIYIKDSSLFDFFIPHMVFHILLLL